ncbi:hypothetical protein, partial [Caballeronia sordidicola]|uniref:hypothetical protein n=2 Tax=Caballeronia TaxID=1827195 RepID=UPI001C4E8CC1
MAMHLVAIAGLDLRLGIVAHRVVTVLRAMANVVRSRRAAMHLVVIAGLDLRLGIAALRVVTVLRAMAN